MIGIHLSPNIDETLAENIDPPLARVVEEVIGMFDHCRRGHDLARFGVEDGQARGHAAADEEPVVTFVEGHRKIRGASRYRPASHYRSLHQIGHFHFLAIGDVDEDAGSRLLQLEGFGMRVHVDIANLLPIGIQDGKRAASSGPCYFAGQKLFAAIADDNVVASGVIADIIGVEIEGHRLQKLICGAIEHLHRAVAAARDEQSVGGRVVVCSLRLVETGDRPYLPACFQIDHFERAIIKCRREEALAFHVHTKMIHASFDLR